MFEKQEKGNTIVAKLRTYSGEMVEFTLDKEEGHSFEIGGTASNQVAAHRADVLSVYTREDDGKEYCDIKIGMTLVPCQRTCGSVYPNQPAFLIETYDVEDQLRWLVATHVPSEANRHFINIDVRDGSSLVKRLRIDPFLGESRVM